MNRSKLSEMDGAWFQKIEEVTGNHWSEHLRGQLRGAVFLCWQEARKNSLPEYTDRVEQARAVKLKAALFRKSIEAANSNLRSLVAQAFGHAGIDQTITALEMLADLDLPAHRRDGRPPKHLLDRLIKRVVEIHVDAGGRAQLSSTGPLAELLRLVHDVMPVELQYETSEGLVSHAEYTRNRWQAR